MATQTQQPESAQAHYALSALMAMQAAKEARAAAKKAGRSGPRAVLAAARVVRTYQYAQAFMSERAVGEMLDEQEIDSLAEAFLNSEAFTTELDRIMAMIEATAPAFEAKIDATTKDFLEGNTAFDRLVESLVQDAGRAAESVATAVRRDIYHVRYVSPPCCARCAVLAGRVYRWSTGFKRHPNCDCSMIPTTIAAPYAQNPEQLFEDGLITDLSKADRQAIEAGADMSKVVNIRRQEAGLQEAGRVLSRKGRPTPEGIYRLAGEDRAKAVALLTKHGYIRLRDSTAQTA